MSKENLTALASLGVATVLLSVCSLVSAKQFKDIRLEQLEQKKRLQKVEEALKQKTPKINVDYRAINEAAAKANRDTFQAICKSVQKRNANSKPQNERMHSDLPGQM